MFCHLKSNIQQIIFTQIIRNDKYSVGHSMIKDRELLISLGKCGGLPHN